MNKQPTENNNRKYTGKKGGEIRELKQRTCRKTWEWQQARGKMAGGDEVGKSGGGSTDSLSLPHSIFRHFPCSFSDG